MAGYLANGPGGRLLNSGTNLGFDQTRRSAERRSLAAWFRARRSGSSILGGRGKDLILDSHSASARFDASIRSSPNSSGISIATQNRVLEIRSIRLVPAPFCRLKFAFGAPLGSEPSGKITTLVFRIPGRPGKWPIGTSPAATRSSAVPLKSSVQYIAFRCTPGAKNSQSLHPN